MEALEQKTGYVLLRVRVQPRAARNAFRMEPGGQVRAHLTAPPVEGAANQALVRCAASWFGLSRAAVTLVKGEKSREKTLRLDGVDAQTVISRLRQEPAGSA